jgi:hypothetical protein
MFGLHNLKSSLRWLRIVLVYKAVAFHRTSRRYMSTPVGFHRISRRYIPVDFHGTTRRYIPVDFHGTTRRYIPVDFHGTTRRYIPVDFHETARRYLPVDFHRNTRRHIPEHGILHKLRLFENMMLRRIFRHKKREIRRRRKLHIKSLIIYTFTMLLDWTYKGGRAGLWMQDFINHVLDVTPEGKEIFYT